MTVLGISGSLTRTSRTVSVVALALEGARDSGLDVATDLLDLRQVPLEFCDGRPLEAYRPETQDAVRRVEAADALVVGTPMYRGTYTGALKNLFDLVRNEPMAGKVVGLVATGGSDHHFLAIEHGLRPLFGFFRAFTVPGGVYAHAAHFTESQLTDRDIREAARDLGRQTVALWRQVQGLSLLTYPSIPRKKFDASK